MKVRICVFALALLAAAGSSRAGTTGYAYCGTYASYVMMYKSTDGFEELGKLRCGEKVEIVTRWFEYFQVRTADGRMGWVHYEEIGNTPTVASQSTTNNFGLTDQGAKLKVDPAGLLNNASILKLHGMKLSSDVIIAKIKSSPCDFDTSAGALAKLKQAGLSDKVILAMVQAPSASAPPAPKVPEAIEVKVPGGTHIEIELNANVSSDAAQEGMIVPLTVAQDVVINGVTVFPHGAEARARVTTMKQPGFMNRPPGEISWTMEYVTAVTGEHIPMNFFSKEASANPSSSFTGAAGPSWEFRKGKPAVVAAGMRFEAVVPGTGTVLHVPQTLAAGASAGQAPNGQSTSQSPAQTAQGPSTKP